MTIHALQIKQTRTGHSVLWKFIGPKLTLGGTLRTITKEVAEGLHLQIDHTRKVLALPVGTSMESVAKLLQQRWREPVTIKVAVDN